jgi:RNA recognition motif-containing protein
MNIYVANLGSHIENEDLRKIFAAYGNVTSATVITDRETNKSKGFAFVEMKNESEAQKAIKELNGFYFQGRSIAVIAARTKEERKAPERKQFNNFWK